MDGLVERECQLFRAENGDLAYVVNAVFSFEHDNVYIHFLPKSKQKAAQNKNAQASETTPQLKKNLQTKRQKIGNTSLSQEGKSCDLSKQQVPLKNTFSI